MNLSRRKLLGGTLALSLVASVPAIAAALTSELTSLEKVNVRRLMMVIEDNLASTMNDTLFDVGTNAQSYVRTSTDSFLRGLRERGVITDYCIVCDETNNPQPVVDENRLVADIFFRLKENANFFRITGDLNSVGVKFDTLAWTADGKFLI